MQKTLRQILLLAIAAGEPARSEQFFAYLDGRHATPSNQVASIGTASASLDQHQFVSSVEVLWRRMGSPVSSVKLFRSSNPTEPGSVIGEFEYSGSTMPFLPDFPGSDSYTLTLSLSDDQIDDLRSDFFYITVATEAFPSGQMRGRLTPENWPTQFRLEKVSQIPASILRPEGVTISGHFAYVGEVRRFNVVDISDPANPQIAGSCAFSGSASPDKIKIAGNYAYTACTMDSELRTFDISNPAAPFEVGVWTNSFQSVLDVAVQGNYAYIANYSNGIEVIEVSDPSKPKHISGCDVRSEALAIAVDGDYALVASARTGIEWIAITNSLNPRRSFGTAITGFASAIFIDGARVFAGTTDSYLEPEFDPNPWPPTPPPFNGLHVLGYGGGSYPTTVPATEIAVANDVVVVSSVWRGSIEAIDVTDPRHLRMAAVPYGPTNLCARVAAQGDTVCVAGFDDGFSILKIREIPRVQPITSAADGSFRLRIAGAAGTSGLIQRTTNLTDWSDWQPFTLSNGPFDVGDTSSDSSNRFYRIVSP